MFKTILKDDLDKSVIIFKDKSKKWITKKQADFILQQSCLPNQKKVLVDGLFYNFASISKILNEKEFYEQFPKERKIEEIPFFNNPNIYDLEGNQQIRKPTKRAREQMKEGFIGKRLQLGDTKDIAEKKFDDFIKKIILCK